jgi:hypothetical protein
VHTALLVDVAGALKYVPGPHVPSAVQVEALVVELNVPFAQVVHDWFAVVDPALLT